MKRIAGSVLLSLLLLACGPGPKPQALKSLEQMRMTALTDPAVQGTSMMDEADKYYKMSVDAWQDSEEERAAEYAMLGQIRVQTAQVAVRRAEAEARLTRAEGRLESANSKIAQIKKEQVGLEQQLVILEAEYTRKESEKNAVAEASVEQQKQLMETLMGAEAEMLKAQAINAEEHAKGKWALALNTLNMAKQYEQQGNLAQAVQLAKEAQGGFVDAYNDALPQWEAAKFAQSKDGRIQALQQDAERSFQIDAIVRPKGATVVMPRLFEKKKSEPSENRLFMLKMAVDLAKSYEEATILIEGHTQSKGKESKNQSLSEERAGKVRDYFVMQGVQASRIRVLGFGENRPRYSNDDKDERGKNDRVEIVLEIP